MGEWPWQHAHVSSASLGRNYVVARMAWIKRLVGSYVHGGGAVHEHASDVCSRDGAPDAIWLIVEVGLGPSRADMVQPSRASCCFGSCSLGTGGMSGYADMVR